jgi:2,4-dienoyl-CoA reductase-like NADH-dependent reductase (Old Yellow Enzyme family)
MPSLFEPVMLGAIQAPDRILTAPLTRARNTRDHVPTPRWPIIIASARPPG